MPGIQHEDIDHTGLTGAGTPQALDTTDSPQFAAVNIGHASDSTISRVSAGVLAIEGTNIVKAGAATGSGLTMTTARLLGRTTASTGAIEEITVGSGLSLAAGALTATGGSGSVVKAATPIHYTGGNVTVNSTTWSDLATYGPGAGAFDLDFTGCVAGDIVFVSISYQAQSDSEYILVTVATIVSASPVNYFGGRTGATSGSGVVCWQAITAREETPGGTAAYVVQSGDLSAGALKLRPYARIHSAGSRIMFGGASEPLHISAWLIRP